MSLRVPDISHYQGTPDWNLFAPSIDGVIIKAGGADAGQYEDSQYARNAAEATRTGVPWIAYYFCDPSGSASQQAAHFASIAGSHAVMADVETGNGDLSGWVSLFLAGLGATRWLYSGLSFSGTHNLRGFHPFVVAAYQTTPPAIQWELWQHTDAATYPGVSGLVDESLFNGTKDELIALMGGDMTPAEVQAQIDASTAPLKVELDNLMNRHGMALYWHFLGRSWDDDWLTVWKPKFLADYRAALTAFRNTAEAQAYRKAGKPDLTTHSNVQDASAWPDETGTGGASSTHTHTAGPPVG